MNQAPLDKTTIIINGQNVVLDPVNLQFDETTLSHYLEHEFGWIDYFGKMLEYAQKEASDKKNEVEATYAATFDYHKSAGSCTEKQAEAKSKSDPKVVKLKNELVDLELNVGLLERHLSAWNKNHDMAQSRGHFLRMEAQKLNKDIFFRTNTTYQDDINEIVKEV